MHYIIGQKGEDISALLGGGAVAEAISESAPLKQLKQVAAAELPAGVEIITMPRLSDTMEEGTVATGLKKLATQLLKAIF